MKRSLSVRFESEAQRAGAPAVDVDVAVSLPISFSGLRRVIEALDPAVPGLRAKLTAAQPSEWARLFPGSASGVADISDTALSPSERRLHRESEQVFRVLNAGARFIVEALKTLDRPIVIRNAGACDLVSLRGFMRAAEWTRLEGHGGEIVMSGWLERRANASQRFEARRQATLKAICERMRANAISLVPTKVSNPPAERPVDAEGRYLTTVVDESASVSRRLAAAVLAIRATFFTTNYEGAMLAAETGLALLDSVGEVNVAEVEREWDAQDDAIVTSAIEVDKQSLGTAAELRALFHRSIGVIQAFNGEFNDALESFERGLSGTVGPEHHAHLRMFRALTLIKRMGNGEKARAEISSAIAGLAGRTTASAALHEGWLRNVFALTWFQEKKLDAAVEEEKAAIRCVGDLHDASATHLKINLISNLSVVQETAKRFDDSIATWRRFEKISGNWGENFHKHHRYRLAGLHLARGAVSEAVQWYTSAYEAADKLGDDYHQQVIAAELGRLALDEQRQADALEWFRKAVGHARAIGCPQRVAESLAGYVLAEGGKDFTAAIDAAEAGSSYPKEREALVTALKTGAPETIKAQLPKPKSKLNRPFDVINIYAP